MLNQIVKKKYQQVAQNKADVPLTTLIKRLQPGNFAFSKALQQRDWALIAECKLASPAKGRLCSRYTATDLAKLYSDNGAAALSVLTDPHFNGSIEHMAAVRGITTLPILRKDFIIDNYQIYEARVHGADAILLIAAILSDEQLTEYLNIAEVIGLDALVEVHSSAELSRVMQTKAHIIGINNRNLRTFTTNINNTFNLFAACDPGRMVISESGIKNGADAQLLKATGLKGILVGEALVTADDITAKTREFALKYQ